MAFRQKSVEWTEGEYQVDMRERERERDLIHHRRHHLEEMGFPPLDLPSTSGMLIICCCLPDRVSIIRLLLNLTLLLLLIDRHSSARKSLRWSGDGDLVLFLLVIPNIEPGRERQVTKRQTELNVAKPQQPSFRQPDMEGGNS